MECVGFKRVEGKGEGGKWERMEGFIVLDNFNFNFCYLFFKNLKLT